MRREKLKNAILEELKLSLNYTDFCYCSQKACLESCSQDYKKSSCTSDPDTCKVDKNGQYCYTGKQKICQNPKAIITYLANEKDDATKPDMTKQHSECELPFGAQCYYSPMLAFFNCVKDCSKYECSKPDSIIFDHKDRWCYSCVAFLV